MPGNWPVPTVPLLRKGEPGTVETGQPQFPEREPILGTAIPGGPNRPPIRQLEPASAECAAGRDHPMHTEASPMSHTTRNAITTPEAKAAELKRAHLKRERAKKISHAKFIAEMASHIAAGYAANPNTSGMNQSLSRWSVERAREIWRESGLEDLTAPIDDAEDDL